MVLVRTPHVTPPYFVCYLGGHGNSWMHYDEHYLGGCHRRAASFCLANKKAGLLVLDLYSITHVTVVVDPIRAKSCRSLRSLFCGWSVIALPVDQQREGPSNRISSRIGIMVKFVKGSAYTLSGNLVSQPSAPY
jgi:hypothetical protein